MVKFKEAESRLEYAQFSRQTFSIYFSAAKHVGESSTRLPCVHRQFEKAASFQNFFITYRTFSFFLFSSLQKNVAGYSTHAQFVTSQFKANEWAHHVI